MDLMHASRQWAERPADERFETLEALHAATKGYFETAATAPVFTRDLVVRATDNDDLVIAGKSGVPATFTDYSFRQLCGVAGVPSGYLADLPAELAAMNLNWGISRVDRDKTTNLLLHKNGGLILRAATSDVYHRIWNWEVAEFCLQLREKNPAWRVPPARPAFAGQPGIRRATAADVLDMNDGFGLSVKVGDEIAPAGLYASSHDLFIFMVNQQRGVDVGAGEHMNRGFFVTNSEVGAASLKFTCFSYEHVCGNHIVWGAKDVAEISLRHVGAELRAKVNEAWIKIQNDADRSSAEDRARVAAARTKVLAAGKNEVIDLVFDKGIFSRKDAAAAYELAEQYVDVHGAPNTAWGFAAGATRLSQRTPFADKRNQIDRAAGKVLQMAF